MSGSVLVTCKGYAVDSTHACSVVDISLGGIAIDCPEHDAERTRSSAFRRA
jgi:hypothetical protein